MKILFLTHPYPNYVPDLLLHGLRKLLDTSVVDYPRKDCVYEGVLGLGVCPDEQKSNNWFPADSAVDRTDIQQKINSGFFDYIVTDIRAMEMATDMLASARCKGVAVIDGEDKPVPMRPGPYLFFQRETDGSSHSIPLPMAMPEEIFDEISHFDSESKTYSVGFVGSLSDQDGFRKRVVSALKEYFPEGLFRLSGVADGNNPVPEGRLGKHNYYKSLQQCETLVTLRGAGYDTFRYWEHISCNSVNVVEKFPLFIPNQFIEDKHLLRFTSDRELIQQIETILNQPDRAAEMINAARKHLSRAHMTSHRAGYFIDKLFAAFT